MPFIPGLNLHLPQLILTCLNIALIHLGTLITTEGIIKGLETKQLSEELWFILQKFPQFFCIYFERTHSSYTQQSSVGILGIFALYEAKVKADIKSHIPALFKETSAINIKCDICSASNLLLPDKSVTTRYSKDKEQCGNSKWKDREKCFIIKDWVHKWPFSVLCEPRALLAGFQMGKKFLSRNVIDAVCIYTLTWPPCHWDVYTASSQGQVMSEIFSNIDLDSLSRKHTFEEYLYSIKSLG